MQQEQPQTASTTDARTHVTYDVFEYGSHFDSRVDLILDPEGDVPHVYTFGRIGSGTPGPVYHNRHLVIATIPREAVGESVEAWIRFHAEEIVGLAERYQGTEWNGHNRVGRWDFSEDEMLADELVQIGEGEIETYWDASDYFEADPSSVVEDAVKEGSIEVAAAAEVSRAAQAGVRLDAEAAAGAIRELLERRIEQLEDSRDAAERLERLRIRRVLAQPHPLDSDRIVNVRMPYSAWRALWHSLPNAKPHTERWRAINKLADALIDAGCPRFHGEPERGA